MKIVKIVFLVSALLLVFSAKAETLSVDLQKAIEIALAENPTIRVADKDIQLKEISNQEAWMSLLPTVSATGTLQHTLLAAEMKLNGNSFKMGNDGTNTSALVGNLNLPVFAPTLYQTMKMTKQDILLAKEKARSSRLSLVNQVTKAFYQLLLAQESLKVMEESYKISKENFDQIDKKFQVGTVSEYDKISAEVRMRAMSTSVVQAKNAVTMANLYLRVLMGITLDITLVADDELQSHENELTLENVENSIEELSNNSSLRQLDINRELLQRTLKRQYTNFMPSIAFSLQGQYQSLYNDNFKLWDYSWVPSSSFTFTLTVPIFTASNWTKVKSTKVQISQLEDTRLNTMRELSNVLSSYKENMISAIAELASNKDMVRQANKGRQIAEKRYDVGRSTVLELNQSELALTESLLTYCQSIYNFLVNKADYDYTLGRGF